MGKLNELKSRYTLINLNKKITYVWKTIMQLTLRKRHRLLNIFFLYAFFSSHIKILPNI